MPLRQYFAWVGSILLAGLFVAEWCFPAPVHAPRSEILPQERVNLRIRSDHKWPEKVVFDTMRSRLTPVADTSPERDVVPSETIAQVQPHAPRDAFAMASARAGRSTSLPGDPSNPLPYFGRIVLDFAISRRTSEGVSSGADKELGRGG
jgi:hypothetical protein